MPDHSVYKKYAALSFLYLSLFCFTVSKTNHGFDSWCFGQWARQIYSGGVGSVYETDTNYLPLFHFFLSVYSFAQSSMEEAGGNVHYLKIFSIVFLVITGYFMLRIMKLAEISNENLVFNTLFLLLNVAVLYNSIIWNQVDIIMSAFVFISAYFAIRKKTLPALVFLLLGLNFKIHAIIFVPIVGLMVLPDLLRSLKSGRILFYLCALAAIQFLILLPFILAGTTHKVAEIFLTSVDKLPFISTFAYNIWYLIIGSEVYHMKDTAQFLGMSYRNWGLILFFVTSGISLIPLIRQCYAGLSSGKDHAVPLEKILIIFTLIPLLFFFFNTQMHERYSHPALAFLITVCVLKKQPILGLICSAAYLLNLEDELRYLELKHYGTLIFDPVFIALLYLSSITWLFILLFRKSPAVKSLPLHN